jgi:hypothetical protein
MKVLSFDVGTKHLALCYLEVFEDGSFEILDWSVKSCVPDDINVNTTSIEKLAPCFAKHIEEHLHPWTSDLSKDLEYVFIESQPMGGFRGSARNLKTKILSHVLQCAIHVKRPNVPIHFVSPSLKLKDRVYEGKKPSYYDNKKYAVEKTTLFLDSSMCKNTEYCKTVFNQKKMKRDDFADAFLQGYYSAMMYLKGNVIVVEEKPKTKKRARTTNK